MIVVFSIGLALFGLLAALASFGGETCPKDSRPLFDRITGRGWCLLACWVLAFVSGSVKEVLSGRAADHAKAEKLRVEGEHRRLLGNIARRIEELKSVVSDAHASGIAIAPVREGIVTATDLADESANIAVSLATRAEERWAANNVSGALTAFLHADRIAPIAELKTRIADCYLRLGEHEAAAEYGRAAIALEPKAARAMYVVAASLMEMGSRDEALRLATASCMLGDPSSCELTARSRSQTGSSFNQRVISAVESSQIPIDSLRSAAPLRPGRSSLGTVASGNDRRLFPSPSNWDKRRLSDGSIIYLYPNSGLEVDFSDQQRSIILSSGQASFNVARDVHRPFVVHTDAGTVKALGTQFLIQYHANAVFVNVHEGQVAIVLKRDEGSDRPPTRLLSAGRRVVLPLFSVP
jgi:tetratricopeptide (TPR) repeat protein